MRVLWLAAVALAIAGAAGAEPKANSQVISPAIGMSESLIRGTPGGDCSEDLCEFAYDQDGVYGEIAERHPDAAVMFALGCVHGPPSIPQAGSPGRYAVTGFPTRGSTS